MEEQLRDGQAPDADITEEMIAACRGRAAFYDMLAAIYFRPLSAEQIENIAETDWSESVSYTHLTLPTICSV